MTDAELCTLRMCLDLAHTEMDLASKGELEVEDVTDLLIWNEAEELFENTVANIREYWGGDFPPSDEHMEAVATACIEVQRSESPLHFRAAQDEVLPPSVVAYCKAKGIEA